MHLVGGDVFSRVGKELVNHLEKETNFVLISPFLAPSLTFNQHTPCPGGSHLRPNNNNLVVYTSLCFFPWFSHISLFPSACSLARPSHSRTTTKDRRYLRTHPPSLSPIHAVVPGNKGTKREGQREASSRGTATTFCPPPSLLLLLKTPYCVFCKGRGTTERASLYRSEGAKCSRRVGSGEKR